MLKAAEKIQIVESQNVSGCKFISLINVERTEFDGYQMKFGQTLSDYLSDVSIENLRLKAAEKGATHVIIGDQEVKSVEKKDYGLGLRPAKSVKISGKSYKCSGSK